MKIYVVRHGQTNNNLEGKINGHNNQKLNATGIKQAQTTGNKLKNKKIDLIISSPLSRALETATIINVNNVPIVLSESIIERDAGKLTNTSLKFIDENDWWNLNPMSDYQDAETVKNVYKRVSYFFDELKQKYRDENILLVTHGGVFKAIHTYFNGMPEDGDLQQFSLDNCAIAEYELY